MTVPTTERLYGVSSTVSLSAAISKFDREPARHRRNTRILRAIRETPNAFATNLQIVTTDRRGNALNKITNGIAGPGALDQHFEDDYSDALVAGDFDEYPSNAGHLVQRGILVSKSFPGIEPDGLRVPLGYCVDDQGIVKMPQSHGKRGHVYPKMVASSPIFIVKKMQNRTTNVCYVRLAWVIDGEWRSETFELEDIMTARRLVGLSKFGVPVSGNSAKDLIDYFVAFEAENRELLRTETVVSHMGWHRSGEHSVFVMGNKCVLPNPAVKPVSFSAAGDAHPERAFERKGTLEGWRGVFDIMTAFPKQMFAAYAACAPALLGILDADGFAVDYTGLSGTGKTTALRFAASFYGSTNDKRNDSMINSWNTTQVCIERRAATFTGLPMIMDDTAQARKVDGKSAVTPVIYMVADGKERGRGALSGWVAQSRWSTIMMMSGEKRAVDSSAEIGLVARVLTLEAPFDGDFDCSELQHAMSMHYGHAGPAFVQWVVTHRAACEAAWRARYEALNAELMNKLPKKKGARVRYSSHLAVVALAGELLHEALGIPTLEYNVIDAVLGTITEGMDAFDRPLQALRIVYDAALRNKANFISDGVTTPYRCCGVWAPDECYKYIGINPEFLKEVLAAAGLDLRSTVKDWAQRQWLDCNEGASLQKKVKRGAYQGYVYAIKRSALIEHCGASTVAEEKPALKQVDDVLKKMVEASNARQADELTAILD